MTAHGTRATRTDRRNTFIGKMEEQGESEGSAFSRRLARAGLDTFPRGLALVRHVALGMETTQSAEQIAEAAGYKVRRCAELVAQAHHAPLARKFLARAAADELFADFVAAPNAEPIPEEKWPERPKPTIAEVLDELEDAAVRGADWESVARMYAIAPESLVRRIERADLVEKVRFWHPTFRKTPRSMRKVVGLCPEGHPVVVVGHERRCRVCEVAA